MPPARDPDYAEWELSYDDEPAYYDILYRGVTARGLTYDQALAVAQMIDGGIIKGFYGSRFIGYYDHNLEAV